MDEKIPQQSINIKACYIKIIAHKDQVGMQVWLPFL